MGRFPENPGLPILAKQGSDKTKRRGGPGFRYKILNSKRPGHTRPVRLETAAQKWRLNGLSRDVS